MYLCISLGFMGRYRQARGEGELERVRAEAHAAIMAQHNAADPELSYHWRGVAAPYRPGLRWRAGLGRFCRRVRHCAGELLFWTSTSLNAASDRLQAQVLASGDQRTCRR